MRQERAVRAYVCEAVPDCSFDSMTLVERLRSGENHVVYRVSYTDSKGEAKDVVVRGGSGDDAERIRARRETAVMHKVGGVAGPEIYDFRLDLIVTPTRVIEVKRRGRGRAAAGRIRWDELDDDKIAEIPLLQRLAAV